MGETAENLVREFGILRAEQDAFAAESQRRAARAIASGRFADEIVPVKVGDRGRGLIPEGGQIPGTLVEKDEHPRPETTPESLAKLPPVFDLESGTVHAGNSSGITDGAAALVLASEEETKKAGVEPLARVAAWASAGVEPARMGVGPVPALRALLDRQKLKLDDVDLIELNEAFAAQVIACARELPFDLARVNVNGGAIALGHPIGATGARISTTLLHEMKKRGAKRGVATLCVSGGMGMAVLFERE
jgi:acetyl-CoA acetyltransferase family protein